MAKKDHLTFAEADL